MTVNIDHLRNVFISGNESLDCYIDISTTLERKKKCILALTVSSVAQRNINIYVVKPVDKNDFKRQFITNVASLTGVDCHETIDRPSYDMEFKYDNRSKRLFALKLEEKHNFIERLIRLISFYDFSKFGKMVFYNLPEAKTVEDFLKEKVTVFPRSEEEESTYLDATDFNRYQNLSKLEEENLTKFLNEAPKAVINATEFQETLRQHMFAMEGTNVHSIMSSEKQLMKLMESMDLALEQVDILESKVEMHEQFLMEVEASMSCLRDRDELLRLTSNNRVVLLESLETLLTRVTLEKEHVAALLQLDVSQPDSLKNAHIAANKLKWLLETPPDADMQPMKCVIDKQDELKRIADEFARRISTQFNNALIRHQSNAMSSPANTIDKLLSEHKRRRDDLECYIELMHWLKVSRPSSFANLKRLYLEKMASLYDYELSMVVENLRMRLSGSKDKTSSSGMSGSQANILKYKKFHIHKQENSQTGTSLPNDPVKSSKSDKFENLFEGFLVKLKPLLLDEESFMTRMFRLDCRRQSERSVSEEVSHQKQPLNDNLLITCSNIVFVKLADLVKNLIIALETHDSSNSLLMVVVVHKQFDETVYSSEFLQITWGILFLQSKRSFNHYIDRFIYSFKDTKVPKKSRFGILGFVNDYASFAEQAFKSRQDDDKKARQNDLITAHLKIVREVMTQVERIASESQKTPREVIIMENFHKMKDILRRLKMPELDELQSELKNKYSDALEMYVDSCVGRPFEKLCIFFESVELALDRGIKPEEIPYQFAYSRKELARVLHEYPGREVKRGLESLCRRLERHLSPEAGDLFPVVWTLVQNQFMNAVKRYKSLIERCYSSTSGLDLDFTTDELQQYFQEIARTR